MYFKPPYLKSFTKKLPDLASVFLANDKGTIAVVFGVALIPVMLSAGIAVDYSRMAITKSLIDEALDAAVLMSGQELSEGKRVDARFRQNFENFFYANVNGRTNLVKQVTIESFSVDKSTGKVSAMAKSDIKMAFMGIVGKTSVEVMSHSEAAMSSKKIELSMMLDVTGSMGSRGKLAALKAAAKDAISVLLPATASSKNMRISLIPYSTSVNVGVVARKVSNNPNNKCVTERYSYRFSDASYQIANSKSKVEGKDSNCPDQEVLPLSASSHKLKKTINKLSAGGMTAGHLGVAWSYYTLSPNWAKAWNNTPTPASYSNKKVQKIALLMTDGQFNKDYTAGWNSSNYAKSICADMKKKGILIYSVAFKAPRSAEATLRSCASPGTSGSVYYYSADNASELKSVFVNIATSIKRLRLSK